MPAPPARPARRIPLGPALLAALLIALLPCPARPAGVFGDQRPRQAEAARHVEITGVRVLDSGLLEPLPPRKPPPPPVGPATLVGGVDGVGAVVATPGQPLPQNPLALPPEREYRALVQAAKVYAAPGQALGFGYVLTGAPAGTEVPVQVHVLLPPARQDGPRRMEIQGRRAVLGRPDWAAWEFGDVLEPGQYVIELRCQGAVLARRVYAVVPRGPEPSPAP